MTSEDKVNYGIMGFLIGVLFVAIVFSRQTPRLDDPIHPFVVKRIEACRAVDRQDYARYYPYGTGNNFAGTKPIILKKNKYHVGDTITVL